MILLLFTTVPIYVPLHNVIPHVILYSFLRFLPELPSLGSILVGQTLSSSTGITAGTTIVAAANTYSCKFTGYWKNFELVVVYVSMGSLAIGQVGVSHYSRR